MPLDKQTNGHPAKPFTPTLSSNFRNAKGSLTPKLAASTPTGLTRRGLPASTPSTPNFGVRTNSSIPSPSIGSNVTPRSGSRKSRLDSGVSPTATPTAPPLKSSSSQQTLNSTTSEDHSHGYGIGSGNVGGLGTGRNDGHGSLGRPRSLMSSSGSRRSSLNADDSKNPMFFHASEAKSKSSNLTSESEPKPKRMRPATFFHANGLAESNLDPNAAQGPRLVAAPEETRPKFFHAGDRQEKSFPMGSNKPLPILPKPPLMQRAPSSSLHRPTSPGAEPTPLRPSHTRKTSRHETLAKPLSLENSPVLTGESSRSASSGQLGHKKSASVGTQQQLPTRRVSLKTSPRVPSGPISIDSASDTLTSLGTPLDPSPRIISSTSSTSEPLSAGIQVSQPQSPTAVDDHTSKIQQMNDLAANARRERKLLDLEISNSSLLAINRTLEREMRKQNAELRRYRRLTRSGRMSAATSTRNVSGVSSEAFSIPDHSGDEDGDAHSALDSLDEEDESEDESETTLFREDGTLSPTTQEDHDAQHRVRDERRLFLDLSKHQQLLIDSQKMNQSIRRCLGWTEELIREGRKALEYNVKVSDVEIGGRVLAPDELDDGTAEVGRGLLSPSKLVTEAEALGIWGLSLDAEASTLDVDDYDDGGDDYEYLGGQTDDGDGPGSEPTAMTSNDAEALINTEPS